MMKNKQPPSVSGADGAAAAVAPSPKKRRKVNHGESLVFLLVVFPPDPSFAFSLCLELLCPPCFSATGRLDSISRSVC